MPVKITSVGMFVLPKRGGAPEHRFTADDLAALPASPGVYIFRGPRKQALYVGKSVDIRKRVKSHLRNADDAALLEESFSIEVLETAGEIGALLQESWLVKRLQPRYNRMLLDAGSGWMIVTRPGQLAIDVMRSPAGTGDPLRVWGRFASRLAAETSREELIAQDALCPALSGLENSHPGRGCFARQLGRCKGACADQESVASYRRRRDNALRRLSTRLWPFKGPVGIVEARRGLTQVHVIDEWSYRGILNQSGRAPLRKGEFDPDVVRIVGQPLLKGELRLLSL